MYFISVPISRVQWFVSLSLQESWTPHKVPTDFALTNTTFSLQLRRLNHAWITDRRKLESWAAALTDMGCPLGNTFGK